jgi:DNA phosphorothioation-dependent restriction protein DptH
MNLYIESMAAYLIGEWDRALKAADGSHEARFMVESLSSDGVFALFQKLDAHRLIWLQKQSIACHFRVATNLWRDWCPTPELAAQRHEEMANLGAVGANGERLWIDEDDRLTWYRNRTTSDEGVDGLVVVLVGLNHATDQGGLADFHRVDESRIWREMGQTFIPWLCRINERLDLNAGDSEMEEFDVVLQQLFLVRPLRLGKLANFLEEEVVAGGECGCFRDLAQRFFRQLPAWGMPPLLVDQNDELRGKKGASLLKEADAFISHQRYKTPLGQKKDWLKIEKALGEADFEIPEVLGDEVLYGDLAAYRETLYAFIHEADVDARARLLRTDLMPLLRILKMRQETNSDKKKTVRAFTGMSFEALLEGIWCTLREFDKQCGHQRMADLLARVHVELIRFDHDLAADEEEGIGAKELARKLLRGCLGGLDKVFEEIDCRLPQDEDQAILPSTQWDRQIPITLNLALDTLTIGVSRARPNVQFKVTIAGFGSEKLLESVFKWVLGPTQPERVLFESAVIVAARWAQSPNPAQLLPAFCIPSVHMTALYFAADESEANRLVIQSMTDLKLLDLLDGLTIRHMDPNLWGSTSNLNTGLIACYRAWLDASVTTGYYNARYERLPALLSAFDGLAARVLDSKLLGARELLRRLYKGFLLIDERTDANDPYLPAAVAWGLSPAVLELSQARIHFLANGFPEAVGELALGRQGQAAFERLLDLAKIHRPLAALVVDSNGHLSASIKSFGMLHYLGSEPSADKSLAVQSLLRDEDSDDDEDVSDSVQSCEERELVTRVLDDYQQLYPFAQDGLRILAVNVRDLQTILAGVDHSLEDYLKCTSADWPAFHCTVMVYSTSSSPMAMEKRLTLWRNHVVERQREKGRQLILSVGHRYAPAHQIIGLLKQEQRTYDIAFLFHFLRSKLDGRAIEASPFEFSFDGWGGVQFPIAEYPRPTQEGDRYRRQSLLSNRRLRIQTRHADLSAKLFYDGSASRDHLIIGQVDYKPWAGVVEALHQRAQWVACVDPFVDKRLLCSDDRQEMRKIVGFTSGLGAYGELNLTISTEQDTLTQLTHQVAGKLTGLLPFAQPDGFEAMAARMVDEAEEIIGLASLRAVVGANERIREVVGFAAIRRALASPPGQMSQLLPVDSLLHWFAGSEVTNRPDLLQLTLEVRPDDIPLVHAVVVECKLAQQNPAHLAKAIEQVQEGLRHLTGLLAPKRGDLRRLGFDRRYWWAQLHRAITSRSVVNLPAQELRVLDQALESLAEGLFEIRWRAAIFTFWTNEAGPLPVVTPLTLHPGTIDPPFQVPAGFAIQHLSLGYDGLATVFAKARPLPLIELVGPAIGLRPVSKGTQETTAEAVPIASTRTSEMTKIPPNDPIPALDASPPMAVVRTQAILETLLSVAGKQSPLVDLSPAPVTPVTPLVMALDAFPLPERILIGTRANGEMAYWHFGHPRLDNRHMLIFGASGSGKTYGIQCLLAEMAEQRLRSLIVDYTDGYLPQQLESRFSSVAVPKNHFVVTEGLPLNPFRRQRQIIDPSIPAIEENPYQVATRIESIFASVFAMGDQQSAALIRVLQAGIEEEPGFALEGILPRLRGDSQNGESLANKLEPLIKSQPFRPGEESAWEGMLSSQSNWVHVLQLKGLAREIQKMVTEFALWDLWDYVQNSGSKDRPIPVVLDEIQNLDHSSDSPIDKMLREGRKFGLSLMLATQTTSQFNQEQRDRLFQAGHKLIFKPATTEIDRFAQLLSQSPTGLSKAEWGQRLASLEKGECWSLGRVLKSGGSFKEEAVRVSVTPLEERHFKV